MTLAAAKLVDWRVAESVGQIVAGSGPTLTPVERARLREDFGELVPRAEALVEALTGLSPDGPRARPWVMTRAEWLRSNLLGFERVIEPLAQRIVSSRGDGALASIRRGALGVQIGGLLGYLGHRVLGQYDLFAPPDDEGMLYFLGANIAGAERRHSFPERDFRLWLALHEVAHRVQFAQAPWLRPHVTELVNSYLSSVEVDVKVILETLARAVEEVRSGEAEWRGMGWLFLLMTPEQRNTFRRMQAVMSLLEGHGNYVMDVVAEREIPPAAWFKRTVHARRQRQGPERAFQKAIGFDVKVRQYDLGERFVAGVVERAGMDGFNRVWRSADNLPTMDEVARPEVWVARVAASP